MSRAGGVSAERPWVSSLTHHNQRLLNADKQSLYRIEWRNFKGAPKALVYVAHGLQEHILRYSGLAAELNKHNFFVFGHDHIGHGQSPGKRAQIKSVRPFVRDAVADVKETVRLFPKGVPLFILGHSMGGLIASLTALELRDTVPIKGIILSAPAIKASPKTATPFKLKMVKLLAEKSPDFGVGKLDARFLTRNADQVAFLRTDPLRYHGKMRAGMAHALLTGMTDVCARAGEIKAPLLVLHGSGDIVTDIAGSIFMADNAASADKTLMIYPGCYHEILHDLPETAAEATGHIVSWMTAVLEGAANPLTALAAERRAQYDQDAQSKAPRRPSKEPKAPKEPKEKKGGSKAKDSEVPAPAADAAAEAAPAAAAEASEPKGEIEAAAEPAKAEEKKDAEEVKEEIKEETKEEAKVEEAKEEEAKVEEAKEEAKVEETKEDTKEEAKVEETKEEAKEEVKVEMIEPMTAEEEEGTELSIVRGNSVSIIETAANLRQTEI